MRNYILDWKLQLRYTAAVSILSTIICGTLGFLIWNQGDRANRMIEQAMKDYDEDLRKQVLSTLQHSDRSQLMIMGVICLVMITVLSMFLIVLTHQVAGPIFKSGTYFEKLQDGKLPEVYDLRKGDQFQDFFRKFRRMVDTQRAGAKADVAAFDKLLGACEAAGVSTSGELGHVLDELRKLKKEKETALA
jgi:hypothetical protein